MAQSSKQSTKSRSKSSTSRNGSQAKSSNSRTSTAKRSTARRGGSTGSRVKSPNATRRGSQSGGTSRNDAGSMKDTVIDRTKAAGHAVAQAASKAKTPLIAGGTALAGAAVGAVVKDRLDASGSNGPLKRLRGSSMAKPAMNLGKVDLDTVKSLADRVSAYGQQASDIAAAMEKTRKKNK